jgi:hypothetical protein
MAGNQPPRWRANAQNGLLPGQGPAGPYLPARNRGPLLQTEEQAQAMARTIGSAARNAVAGGAGLGAGDLAGFGRAAYRLPSEISETAGDVFRFGANLAAPITPDGQAAWSRFGQGVGQAIGGLRYAAAHPDAVAAGAARAIHDLGTKVKPDIDAGAANASEQFRRNFEIGKNGGDLQFQGALAALPGPKLLGPARALTKEELMARFLSQKFSMMDAEYLAEPYPWKGHHALARRTKFPEDFLGMKLPASVAGKPLPKFIVESPFNLLKPAGISRGEFYTLHAQVDPKFHGTGGLPDSRRWSRKDLGIRRYDPIRRTWYGTPAATKKALAGIGAGGAGAGVLASPGEQHGGRR